MPFCKSMVAFAIVLLLLGGILVPQSAIANCVEDAIIVPGGLKTVYVYDNTDLPTVLGLENTRFVFTKDIELSGKKVKVGAYSILDFQGGSISNGELVLSDSNEIVGIPRLYTLFSGNYTKTVDVSWFITEQERLSDASKRLVEICSMFKHIKSDGRTYFLSHQVFMDGMEYLNLNSEFRYNGKEKNISVFYISSSHRANLYIHKIIHDGGLKGVNAKNLINDTDCIIGVNFVNVDNSYIKTDFIYCFNEGIRLSAINQNPFSYNKIYPGEIVSCNRGIRVFQDSGGWANENYFYGGRIFIDTPAQKAGMKKVVAIHIEGAGKSDTFNRVDALSFSDFCVEGYKNCLGYTVFAKNVSFCSFNNFRNEGGDYLIKFIGKCFNNKYSLSYYNSETNKNTEREALVDVSECTSGALSPDCFTRVVKQGRIPEIKSNRESLIYDEDMVLRVDIDRNSTKYPLFSHIISNYQLYPTYTRTVGYIIDFSKARERLVAIESNKPVVFRVQYITDSSGDYIPLKQDPGSFRAPNHEFMYDKTNMEFKDGASGSFRRVLNIPPNVNKAFIGVSEVSENTTFDIYTRFGASVTPYADDQEYYYEYEHRVNETNNMLRTLSGRKSIDGTYVFGNGDSTSIMKQTENDSFQPSRIFVLGPGQTFKIESFSVILMQINKKGEYVSATSNKANLVFSNMKISPTGRYYYSTSDWGTKSIMNKSNNPLYFIIIPYNHVYDFYKIRSDQPILMRTAES